MITYNHQEFIAKALDSILMQKTNFDYEIVIGEDCSTDKTRDIVIDYRDRYPDKFRLLLNGKNLGMYRNSKQTFESCKGKYIAMLEGDDYWTSPDKLQKQVDFLDNHHECAICFHNVAEIYKDGSRAPHDSLSEARKKEFFTVDDLLRKNFMATPSVMYRNGLVEEIPEWFSSLKLGDWPLHILHALHGQIGYIDEVMAVHLNHQGGVWTRMSSLEHAKALVAVYDHLYAHLGPKYGGEISRYLHDLHLMIAEMLEDMGELAEAKKNAVRSFANHFKVSKKLVKLLARLYMPRLYKLIKRTRYAILNI